MFQQFQICFDFMLIYLIQGGYGYGGGAWGPYGHQGGYQPRGGAQGYGAYPRKQELGWMESLRCICIEYNYALGNHL